MHRATSYRGITKCDVANPVRDVFAKRHVGWQEVTRNHRHARIVAGKFVLADKAIRNRYCRTMCHKIDE